MYNIVFEQTVISSVINSFTPDEREAMMLQLSEDIFYLPAHQNIYAAINELNRTNKPIDEEFIKSILQRDKLFDEQVMLSILMASPVNNIEPYAVELKALLRKRKLHHLSLEMQKMLTNGSYSADDVQAFVDKELQNMEQSSGIIMPKTMKQAIYDYNHMQEPPKIQTGIKQIDDMLCGGIEPAQLVHIGGEKNVGKTTLLKQILHSTSVGYDSLFFSFEMPEWKMAKYTQKIKGPSNLERYHIIDTQMMKTRDVMDVARMIRIMHRKHKIQFVLIDSKMKLEHKTFKGSNDGDKKGDIDAILNAVVQETGIVLMLITQLSKKDMENGTMSNYGSGLSDYEADMQIMMYHSKDNDNSVELKVSKNRQEVKFEPIKLWFDKEELKFTGVRVVETAYTTVPQDNINQYQTQQQPKQFNDMIDIAVIG